MPASRRSERSALDVAGLIGANSVWDADTVRVLGDVEVADSVTLTIAAGVRVEFQGYRSLTVRGRILALGTPEERVLFTSAHPDSFAIDSTTAGAWAGIRFPFTSEINETSRLEYCVIEYAKNAGGAPRGGALQVNGFSKLRALNTIFRRNAADYGGAIACTHYASPEITGCLLVENVAFRGGSAIHCIDAYPRITNCTIVDNEDRNPEVFDPAAAIYAHISRPRITGSIVQGNISHYFEPAPVLYGKSYYTTWSDMGDGWPGEGNIDEDPLFVGSGEHSYALSSASPCVNAGRPDTTGLGLPPLDLAGLLRVAAGRVDMGAYEGTLEATGVPLASDALFLAPNRPNPFSRETTISFRLRETRPVRVSVIDVTGRRVAVLADDVYEAGAHAVEWDGRDAHGRAVASGVYFARLEAGDRSESRRIVLLRR